MRDVSLALKIAKHVQAKPTVKSALENLSSTKLTHVLTNAQSVLLKSMENAKNVQIKFAQNVQQRIKLFAKFVCLVISYTKENVSLNALKELSL
jgi:aromatic ring-opening dioxygenase LigB subunit